MTDTLTTVATVYQVWADEDIDLNWVGRRTYADIELAKACAAHDYAEFMAAEKMGFGPLEWRLVKEQWQLLDNGHRSDVYIEVASVYGRAGASKPRGVTVGEAIIALVPGAEGAGVKP
jgi:hypothetical protein